MGEKGENVVRCDALPHESAYQLLLPAAQILPMSAWGQQSVSGLTVEGPCSPEVLCPADSAMACGAVLAPKKPCSGLKDTCRQYQTRRDTRREGLQ